MDSPVARVLANALSILCATAVVIVTPVFGSSDQAANPDNPDTFRAWWGYESL